MSSPAQATAVLPPDPVLPRRDDLLDVDVVGARLDDLLDQVSAPLTGGCSLLRVKYRMGESLRATFRLGRGVGSDLVSARMFPEPKAAGEFRRAREVATGQGAGPGSVLLDQVTSTVFWVFPQDRKLVGLDRLTGPPPELRGVFGIPWTQSELKAYKPERAATVRCADPFGATVGYAKVQPGQASRRSVALLRAARRGIDPHGVLRLPEGIGYLPAQHMALFSAAPGRPLNQVPWAAYPSAMATLGAALSVLHGRPPGGLQRFTRFDPDGLVPAADLVRAARPDLASVARELRDVLLRTAPPRGPDVLLHGDVHAKNVLVLDDAVSLIDLDEAGAGPAAADLGGMLARFWCPRPHDVIDRDTARAAAESLLAAYDRRPSPADVLWYAAAALLAERAVRAINRVDAAAIADLERVLVTALRWVKQRKVDDT